MAMEVLVGRRWTVCGRFTDRFPMLDWRAEAQRAWRDRFRPSKPLNSGVKECVFDEFPRFFKAFKKNKKTCVSASLDFVEDTFCRVIMPNSDYLGIFTFSR